MPWGLFCVTAGEQHGNLQKKLFGFAKFAKLKSFYKIFQFFWCWSNSSVLKLGFVMLQRQTVK